MSESIRVLVISDHLLFGECLAIGLSRSKGMTVVGVMSDTKNVVGAVLSLRPDFVLVDVGLAGNSPFELTTQVTLEAPDVKLIFLGTPDSEELILKCIEAGANGYLLKDASLDDLVSNIHSVHSGQTACSPRIAYSVFSKVAELALRRSGRSVFTSNTLTPRELQVLRLIAEGLSNKQIAQKLNLSLYTAKNHVHNIIEKLHANNRLEAARYAFDNGLALIGRGRY
jgi:DNA-binding NarL/FixJ family response regulator